MVRVLRMRWIRLHEQASILSYDSQNKRKKACLGITCLQAICAAELPLRLELGDHPLDLDRLSS